MITKTSLSKYLSVLFLIGSLLVLTTGCEKKPEGEKVTKDTTAAAEPGQQAVDTTKAEYPDLIGTWAGTFESHGATLKVTEQDGGDFKANLSVAYRQPMNKSITGIIDPATEKITMQDDVKSRTESTYSAELSGDGKTISGTSTLKARGTKASFTFKKK